MRARVFTTYYLTYPQAISARLSPGLTSLPQLSPKTHSTHIQLHELVQYDLILKRQWSQLCPNTPSSDVGSLERKETRTIQSLPTPCPPRRRRYSHSASILPSRARGKQSRHQQRGERKSHAFPGIRPPPFPKNAPKLRFPSIFLFLMLFFCGQSSADQCAFCVSHSRFRCLGSPSVRYGEKQGAVAKSLYPEM